MSDTQPRPVDYTGRTDSSRTSLIGVYRSYETLPNGTTVQVMPDDDEIRAAPVMPEEIDVHRASPDAWRVCIGHTSYAGAAGLPLRFGDGICPVCVLGALEAGQATLRNADAVSAVLEALPEAEVIESVAPDGGTVTSHRSNFLVRGLLKRLLASHQRRFERAARVVEDARRWEHNRP